MKKILSIAIVLVFAVSMMSMATFTASAETTVIYKFTFETPGADTILVKAGEPVGEIVEFGAAGNHALKYPLDATTHTGAGVHPYIWPQGINGILTGQGDLGAGETYELTIDIACDGLTQGSYMYPFLLCNGELDNENYFDRSSFSPSGSLSTYTFVLSSLAEGVPLKEYESGGIAFVDELTLDDGCNMYIDNVTFVKKGEWKPLDPGAGCYYRNGTKAEGGLVPADFPSDPESQEPSNTSEEPSGTSEDSGDPGEFVTGDANGDNAVDMKDVLVIRKAIANMEVTINAEAADANGDGSVDMKDVLLIRKFIAKVIDTL